MPNAKFEQIIFGDELQAIQRVLKDRVMDWRQQLWTCQDGRKVTIEKMASSHLMNTLAYLCRKSQTKTTSSSVTSIPVIVYEAIYRGFIPVTIFDLLSAITADKLIEKGIQWFNAHKTYVPKICQMTNDDIC